MKTAMKAGDKARLDVLRFALSGLNSALKEKQMSTGGGSSEGKDPATGATLADEDVVMILQKEAKRRKESIALFHQGNREDLASKEEAELAIIAEYLPAEMSREEIAGIVDGLIAGGNNEFSTLMREVSKVTKGRADGKLVAEIVKEKTG
jgi:uncharacterized protein YqeY